MGTRSKTRHPGILRDNRSGKYVVRMRDRHGRQRSKSFAQLRDAVAWQAEQRTDPTVEPTRRTSTVTFDDYAASIPEMHPDWRPGTVKNWEARRRRSARIGFGDLRLTEIRAGDIQRALAALRSDGLGDRTLDATRGVITSTYRHALADDLVDLNPVDKLPRTKRVDKAAVDIHQSLSPEQFAAVLDALPGPLRAFAIVQATAGLRPSEAAGITADQLDLLHGTLTVDRQLTGRYPNGEPMFGPPKTVSSHRIVDLSDFAIRALEHHLSTYGLARHGLVFGTARLGTPLDKTRISEAWRRWVRPAVELPAKVRGFHCLRHTNVTTAMSAGVPVNLIASTVGHKHAGVTLSIYTHDDPVARKAARNTVADALAPAVGL